MPLVGSASHQRPGSTGKVILLQTTSNTATARQDKTPPANSFSFPAGFSFQQYQEWCRRGTPLSVRDCRWGKRILPQPAAVASWGRGSQQHNGCAASIRKGVQAYFSFSRQTLVITTDEQTAKGNRKATVCPAVPILVQCSSTQSKPKQKQCSCALWRLMCWLPVIPRWNRLFHSSRLLHRFLGHFACWDRKLKRERGKERNNEKRPIATYYP